MADHHRGVHEQCVEPCGGEGKEGHQRVVEPEQAVARRPQQGLSVVVAVGQQDGARLSVQAVDEAGTAVEPPGHDFRAIVVLAHIDGQGRQVGALVAYGQREQRLYSLRRLEGRVLLQLVVELVGLCQCQAERVASHYIIIGV